MKEWAAAFVAAQADMPDIPKTSSATIPTKGGTSFSYRYADLPAVLAAVKPVLQKHGLAVSQEVTSGDGTVGVSTTIWHTSGESVTFGPVLLAVAGDARAAGSAVTYARRYSLTAALGIAPDDDDDGAAAKPAKRKPAPKPDDSPTEVPPEEAAKLLENACRLELFNRVGKDKEQAEGYWPVVLKDAGVKQVRTKADRAKVIAKIQEMFPTESEAPF